MPDQLPPDDDVARMTSREDIERVYLAAARTNACQAPLFKAASMGVVQLAFFHDPGLPFPRTLLEPTTRPVIVIVGDDPPAMTMAALGPDPWVMRRRLPYWCPRRALVHATGGSSHEYSELVDAAIIFKRVLLIETGSAQAEAWRDAVAHLCPTAVLLPSNGVHPIAEARH